MAKDNELKNLSTEELIRQKQLNSGAWHTDPDNQSQYEAANKDIMAELDRRSGGTSTLDTATGTWSTKFADSDPTPADGGWGASAPVYSGQWQQTTDELARKAMNMSYEDWTQGADYQALAGRYQDMGRMAMDDTVGQVSARTGGLASSYATTAAQQQYNRYMGQLEEVARQMYAALRGDALQNVQLAGSMADREYNQYLDQLGQYNTDRTFNYGVYQDKARDSQWQQSFDRGVFESDRDYEALQLSREQQDARDQLGIMLGSGKYGAEELPQDLVQGSGYAPATWEATDYGYAEARADKQQAKAQSEVNAILQSGGTPSPELIAASGYSDEYVQAMVSAYQRQAATASKASGGGDSTKKTGENAWQGTQWYKDAVAHCKGLKTTKEVKAYLNMLESQPYDGVSDAVNYIYNIVLGLPGRQFDNRDAAIEYLESQGVIGAMPMDKNEWTARHTSYDDHEVRSSAVTDYDTYEAYLTAYVEYCLDEAARVGG